jgi:hypothetical protein
MSQLPWHHAANEILGDHRGQAQRCPAFRGALAAPLPEMAGVGLLKRIAKVAATSFILMSWQSAFLKLEATLL